VVDTSASRSRPHPGRVTDERTSLLSALSPVLDAVGRMNGGTDLTASLQAVIEGIIQATGFGAGAIDYVRTDGTMEIVAVAGPDEARETLLGMEVPPGALNRELEVAERWGRLRFLPHGLAPDDVPYVWTPDLPLPQTPDGWHPGDSLLAPLYAGPGELVGILSVDMPINGRRPDAFQRQLLELLAGQAETALQNARRASRLRASEESFRLAFEATAVGMAMISLDHRRPLRLLQANRALGRIAEAAGREPVAVLSDLLDPADPDHDPGRWSRAIRSAPAGVYRAEKQLCGPTDELSRIGERPWVHIIATVLPLHSTETGRAIVQVEDITERRHRATSDPLTGLANRTRLNDCVTAATEAVRAGGPRAPCCSATSTTSSPSTTCSGIWRVTPCCGRAPGASPRRCGAATTCSGSAATSSRSSCRPSRATGSPRSSPGSRAPWPTRSTTRAAGWRSASASGRPCSTAPSARWTACSPRPMRRCTGTSAGSARTRRERRTGQSPPVPAAGEDPPPLTGFSFARRTAVTPAAPFSLVRDVGDIRAGHARSVPPRPRTQGDHP